MLLTLLTFNCFGCRADSLSLSAMSDWSNAPHNNSNSIGVAYDKVVRQLGAAIANRPVAPVRSLGFMVENSAQKYHHSARDSQVETGRFTIPLGTHDSRRESHGCALDTRSQC